jgi:hypothetical protein
MNKMCRFAQYEARKAVNTNLIGDLLEYRP